MARKAPSCENFIRTVFLLDLEPNRHNSEAADLDIDSEEEEEDLSDNYKEENAEDKARLKPHESPTPEIDDSGCCYGWLGLRFLADKVGSLFFEDPIETITAGTFAFCSVCVTKK